MLEKSSPDHEVKTSLILRLREKKHQILVTFAASIGGIICGTIIGWTSPAIPKLLAPDTPIVVTETEISWITSLTPLGGVAGPFIGGYVTAKFGRKVSLLYSSIPAFISWICLAEGRSIGVVYFARFSAGICMGWIYVALPIYLAEVTEKTIRGALASLWPVFILVGSLFDYGIGPWVPYEWLPLFASIIPVLYVAIFMWMPESPYYLIAMGEYERAEEVLMWLRRQSREELAEDFKTIKINVEESLKYPAHFKDLFATKGSRKAVVISFVLVTIAQLSGISAVIFNAQQIFQDVGSALSPEVSNIVVGVSIIPPGILTMLLVEKYGRRSLLLYSAAGMAVSHGVLGLCFYLGAHGYDSSSISVVPLLAVMAFIIIYSTGFGPMSHAVLGEIFSPKVKSLGCSLSSSVQWLVGFLVTRFFQDVAIAIGNDFAFWIFAIFCLSAIPFVFILLPETKGKTLEEILEILEK